MDSYTVEIYPTRFGFMVRPIIPQIGFDYNRVYNSVDWVIKDFFLHGWYVESITDNVEPRSGQLYTLRRRNLYEPIF